MAGFVGKEVELTERWESLLGHPLELLDTWQSRTAAFLRLSRPGAQAMMIAKCFVREPGSAQQSYDVMLCICAAMSSRQGFTIPEVVAFDPVVPAILMTEVEGVSADSLLVEMLVDDDHASAKELVARMGGVLAAFHLLDIPEVPTTWSGDRRPDIARDERLTFGDFGPHNILVKPDNSLALIDLPADLAIASVTKDLAAFAFFMRRLYWRTIQGGVENRRGLSDLIASFRGGYREARSWGSTVRFEPAARRAEARRALNMARKRWRSWRIGSSLQYGLWGMSQLIGVQPRIKAKLL